MGREVRMVPADWQHPKDDKGNYIPLFDYDFKTCLTEWKLGAAKWAEGLRKDYKGGWQPIGTVDSTSYSGWAGEKPEEAAYMPAFAEGTAMHYMMYETVSEGTPTSPAFATPEELAHWLTDNEASAFADMKGSYEGWLRVCKGGYAPSGIIDASSIRPGVEL